MSSDSFEMMLDMTSKDIREFTWNCIKALAVVGFTGCLYIAGRIVINVVSCSIRLGTIIYKIVTKKKPNKLTWAILVGHQSPTAQAFMNYTNYLGYSTAHFALDASLNNHLKSNKLLCDKSFDPNQLDNFIAFLNENEIEYVSIGCAKFISANDNEQDDPKIFISKVTNFALYSSFYQRNAGNFINIWHEIDSLRGPTIFNCQQAYLHQLNDCLHAQFMSSDNIFVIGLELPSPYNLIRQENSLLKPVEPVHIISNPISPYLLRQTIYVTFGSLGWTNYTYGHPIFAFRVGLNNVAE